MKSKLSLLRRWTRSPAASTRANRHTHQSGCNFMMLHDTLGSHRFRKGLLESGFLKLQEPPRSSIAADTRSAIVTAQKSRCSFTVFRAREFQGVVTTRLVVLLRVFLKTTIRRASKRQLSSSIRREAKSTCEIATFDGSFEKTFSWSGAACGW
jgi:hypothetical protein